MTPKEKALELVEKFRRDLYQYYVASYQEEDISKKGALISLEYIISCSSNKEHLIFWREVKKQIEIL